MRSQFEIVEVLMKKTVLLGRSWFDEAIYCFNESWIGEKNCC